MIFNKSFCFTFCLLMLVWIVLSGRFDWFHLSLGVLSSFFISLYSRDIIFVRAPQISSIRILFRLLLYIPWLIYQIFLSSIHVLYIVLHPRMMELIDPKIIKFDTSIDSTMGRVTFANSITLTPGTITVYLSLYGYLKVHALDKACRDSLPGEMEQRIKAVFDR